MDRLIAYALVSKNATTSNYNAANDTIAFRFRLGGDNKTYFSAIAAVGIDANNDGIIDVLVGVDNQGNSNLLRIWDPGLGTNPKETTLTPTNYFYPEIHSTATTTGNYSYVTVSSSTDPDYSTINPWTNNIDSNINGNINDYFLSFQVPFKDILAYLNNKGISITSSTSVRFMFGTSTQANSINSDIGFVSGQIGSTSPWNTIGALTELVAPNPVTVMDVTPNSGSEGTVAANKIEHTVRLSGTDKYKDTTVNLTLNGYSGDGTVFYNETITSIGDRYADISKVQYSFNGTDFIDATVTNGAFSVVVPKGEIQAFTVRIVTKPDNYYENNEWYQLSARTSANTTEVTGLGTINDDDGVPKVSIRAIDAEAVEGVDPTVQFTVELSHPSSFDTGVVIHPDKTLSGVVAGDIEEIHFIVYGETSQDDIVVTLSTHEEIESFFNADVSITIPAYARKSPVCTITFRDDDIYEIQEKIVFALAEVTNATINLEYGSATATIYDEDGSTLGDHQGDIPILTISTLQEYTTATEGDASANTLVYQVSQSNLSTKDTLALVKINTAGLNSASIQDIESIAYQDINGEDIVWSSQEDISAALTGGIQLKIGKGFLDAPKITVTVKEDALYEGLDPEHLTLSLYEPDNALISTENGSASGTIIDSDLPPYVTEVHGSASYEGTAADPNNPGYINHLSYHVHLSHASDQPTFVTIELVQDGSTADLSEDLNRENWQLHISFDNENWHKYDATQLTAEVNVPAGVTGFYVHAVPVADSIYEPDETVILQARVEGQAELASGSAAIINDDLPPIFTVSNALATDATDSSYAVFTVDLFNPSYQAITLDLSTGNASDTAEKNYDYGPDIEVSADGVNWNNASSVTFAPGVTQMLARVEIVRDTVPEGNEFLVPQQNLWVTLGAGRSPSA